MTAFVCNIHKKVGKASGLLRRTGVKLRNEVLNEAARATARLWCYILLNLPCARVRLEASPPMLLWAVRALLSFPHRLPSTEKLGVSSFNKPHCGVTSYCYLSAAMVAYEESASLIAGTVVMQIFSTAALGLRLWSRRDKFARNWAASEWLIICAWIVGLGLSIMELYGRLTCLKRQGSPHTDP